MKSTLSKKHYLSVFGLAMLNVAAVMSLRGLPLMAKEGLTMIFYILFSSILFLIPVSLVSAELATGWPKAGGVYRWVSEAYGTKTGFVAIWLQWLQNVIWYPTVLSFAAAALSYLFYDQALAANKYYNFAVILIIYWGATFASFKGLKTAGRIATFGVIGGTLLPGLIIIILGILWLVMGNPLELIHTGQPINFLPDFNSFNSLAFLAGIVLLFAGMEVGAVHVTEMQKPKTQFPSAIFTSMIVIIVIFTLGSLSIASVIPAKDIDLNSGIMQGLDQLLTKFNIHWLLPVMGFLIAFGSVGGVLAWIIGPSKGLLATAKDGDLPPFMAKTNKKGVQTNILIVQGLIVSLAAVVFLIMPTVSSAFFILSILTIAPYLIMYFLLFISAIKLRYSQPDVPRAFKLPMGNFGMWLIAGIGIIAVTFAFFIGFFPPAQLAVGSPVFYVCFLAGGIIVFVATPLLINKLRNPSWKQENNNNNK